MVLLFGSANFRRAYSAIDLVSPILVFLFLLFVVYAFVRIHRKNKPYVNYLLISFLLKTLGFLLTSMMYGLYYGYGDTFGFFKDSNELYTAFLQNPLSIFNLLNSIPAPTATKHIYNVSFLFSIISGNSYYSVSLIFTFLSVVGGWLIYLVLIDIYPTLKKQLAIASLFIPSIWFWGTGLQKESLMIFGIGIVFYCYYQLFLKRSFKWYFIPLLVIGYYAIMVKSYAFYLLLLFLGLWSMSKVLFRIKLKPLRIFIVATAFTFILAGSGYYFYASGSALDILLEESGALNTAIGQAEYLKKVSERKEGSAYDLGPMDNSVSGLLLKFGPAVNVTFFRPYLWESRKIINLPAALESFLTLLFFLYILLKTRVIGFIKIAINSPFILSCMIYCILFAFIVGLTSVNFGALVRYKLPVITFFYSLLVIVLYEVNQAKKAI